MLLYVIMYKLVLFSNKSNIICCSFHDNEEYLPQSNAQQSVLGLKFWSDLVPKNQEEKGHVVREFGNQDDIWLYTTLSGHTAT